MLCSSSSVVGALDTLCVPNAVFTQVLGSASMIVFLFLFLLLLLFYHFVNFSFFFFLFSFLFNLFSFSNCLESVVGMRRSDRYYV